MAVPILVEPQMDQSHHRRPHFRTTRFSSSTVSLKFLRSPSQTNLSYPASNSSSNSEDVSRGSTSADGSDERGVRWYDDESDSDDGGIIIPENGNDRRLPSRESRKTKGIYIRRWSKEGKWKVKGKERSQDIDDYLSKENGWSVDSGTDGIWNDGRVKRMVVENNIGWMCATSQFHDYPRIFLLCDEVSSYEDSAEKAARALRKEIKYGKGEAPENGARLMGVMFFHSTLRFQLHLASPHFLQVIEGVHQSPKTKPIVKAMIFKALSAMAHASQDDPRLSLIPATFNRIKPPNYPLGGIPLAKGDTTFAIGPTVQAASQRRAEVEPKWQHDDFGLNQGQWNGYDGQTREESSWSKVKFPSQQQWQSLDLATADYYPPFVKSTQPGEFVPVRQESVMPSYVHTSLLYPEPS